MLAYFGALYGDGILEHLGEVRILVHTGPVWEAEGERHHRLLGEQIRPTKSSIAP